MVNDTKIKPCPFCGNEDIEVLSWYKTYYYAKCDECGLFYKPSLGHKCEKLKGGAEE